ncbi:hypothetical protein EDB92DRAFT_2105413 [Lactarius akahatsu]|uniref:Uncharacterized protein n=1 Tax=Lactarius akahatsu TaxID=416441 RepID=A0AAD4LBZ2_9AGAM|nr:hypothetical protein EDB92DRAFT_2105413 [Lactarius akahatsu]
MHFSFTEEYTKSPQFLHFSATEVDCPTSTALSLKEKTPSHGPSWLMISNRGPTSIVDTAHPGLTVPLQRTALLVSDPDGEIFLLYTHLVALIPADRFDTGHFYGLRVRSGDSNQDTLLVCTEPRPPPGPTCEPHGIQREDQMRKRRRKVSVQKANKERRWRSPVVTVFEYVIPQDNTDLGGRSGDAGSALWKTRVPLVSYFHRGREWVGRKWDLSHSHWAPSESSANITQRTSLRPSRSSNRTFSSSATVTASIGLPSRCADVRRADPPDVLLVVGRVYHPVLRPLAHDADRSRDAAAVVVAELRTEDVLREFLQGWIALGWWVWSAGEDLLGARWGRGSYGARREAVIPAPDAVLR